MTSPPDAPLPPPRPPGRMMTTMTTTLAEFLLARIAEDEADARLAMKGFTTGTWTYDGGVYAGHESDDVADWIYNEASAHVARWDPARVLAECEAKREIIEEHGTWQVASLEHETRGQEFEVCRRCRVGELRQIVQPCPTLRALALPYADHPDYLAEWRP